MVFKMFRQVADVNSVAELQLTQSNTRDQGSCLLQSHVNCTDYYYSYFPYTIRDWKALPTDPIKFHIVYAFRPHLNYI